MRKDIQAINEAYQRATSTPDLKQIFKGYPHDRLIEVWHPSYLDVDDESAEPVDVLYVFLYTPESKGDYDTPTDPSSLRFLGSFYNDEYVDINEDDVYEATAKAQQEIATGEDEEGSYVEDEEYGHEIESESDEQRLNRLYDEYDEALMRDDMASAREIGLEIAELTGDQNDDEYGSHESEEYGDEHNYV